MATSPAQGHFSDDYEVYRRPAAQLGETASLLEAELQALWHSAKFPDGMTTCEGHRVRIVSPGWWNKQAGPDFLNAQVEFNGRICTGAVEIHLNQADWYAHGHHVDPAYNEVMLHVIQALPQQGSRPPVTQSGQKVATLVIPGEILKQAGDTGSGAPERCGRCAEALARRNTRALEYFLDLAGEWRMLDKARRIRERARRAGMEQALYETFMAACGYSRYKKAFQLVGEALPYDRARQLARQDPMSLEAAFLRLAGLWPETWTYATAPPEHYNRIATLLREQLPGLKSLEIVWQRSASRPANGPERRLAGAARFLTRTAGTGLQEQLKAAWRQPMSPLERRRTMEALFGGATGFWANHYTWNGKRVQKPAAPLGEGRIRSIIGNVLIPAALAEAREDTPDAALEKNVYGLFVNLPREPENAIHKRMIQWLALGGRDVKINFRRQQGLLQIHEDWCAHNPSCQNCSVLAYLGALDGEELAGVGDREPQGIKGPKKRQVRKKS